MSYSVSVFTNWVSNYQSWDDLKAWLTSAEGGSLRVVEPRDSDYAIVRYNKGTSNFSLEHVSWCRSVVVHKASRLPVSVAPPKASELDENEAAGAMIAEEFVDGTMLNVFNYLNSETLLATRSRLNANSSFYANGPTFASMFADALATLGVETSTDLLPKDGVAHFASTVVQHPGNRIVKVVATPTLTVVHQGWTEANGTVHLVEDASQFQVKSSREDADLEVQGYKMEPIRAAKSVKEWVAKQAQDRGYGWQGLVLKDGAGKRWRVRSEIYETVRRIRGNESTLEERFARLRKTRTKDQYEAFFPEDKTALYNLEGRLRKNTRNLSRFYTDVFRARSVPYHELPWPYKHHVSVLHNLFKDTLRAQKKKVDLEAVIHYVNGLNQDDLANMLKEHNLELKPSTRDAPAVAPVEEVVVV